MTIKETTKVESADPLLEVLEVAVGHTIADEEGEEIDVTIQFTGYGSNSLQFALSQELAADLAECLTLVLKELREKSLN